MNSNKYQTNRLRFTFFLIPPIAILFFWIYPGTRIYFDAIDESVFYFFNYTIQSNTPWPTFWAITNMRVFDSVSGLIIFVILMVYAFNNNGERALKKLIYFSVFIVILHIGSRTIVGEILEFMEYERESPSLVLDQAIRVSKIVKNIDFKDASHKCFPGDHASVLTGTVIFFFIHGSRTLGFVSCVTLLPFMIPRIAVGAHWLTDCMIGSLSLTLFVTNIWFNLSFMNRFCAALYNWFVKIIDRLIEPFQIYV